MKADILMEEKGRQYAQQILNDYFEDFCERQVSVFCGACESGGIGLVLARYLSENKVPVVCYITPPPSGQYEDLVMRNLKRAFVCHTSVKEIENIDDLKAVAAKTYVAVDALGTTAHPLAAAARAIIKDCANIVSAG